MPVHSTLRRSYVSTQSFPCLGCGTPLNTRQGLAAHYRAKEECRREKRKLEQENTIETSSSDSDIGSDHEPRHHPYLSSDDEERPRRKRTKVTIEDANDLDDDTSDDTVETSVEEHPLGGKTFGRGTFEMENLRDFQIDEGIPHTAPFVDDQEYRWYKWMLRAVPSITEIDNGLKLDMTQERICPTYKSSRTLLEAIETLPSGPEFVHQTIEVTGDLLDEHGKPLTETVDFWFRDPVACVRELLNNPALKHDTVYKPRTVKQKSGAKIEQVYDEMWTGDWWWNAQNAVPDDATIAPLIVASDKTKLSYFRGDKAAWPVYLSIGNIAKDVRRTISKRATVLLGYLPATNFEEIFANNDHGNAKVQDVFHTCMTAMLEPLIAAGTKGTKMVCPDGFIRKIFPILAAYMADFPEQCMIACTRQSSCPKCDVQHDQRGEPFHSELRLPEETLRVIRNYIEQRPGSSEAFNKLNLRNNWKPFWAKLPHTNIHVSITPDILHQLHKGVFKDHLYAWCASLLGPREMDQRFKAMPSHPSVRHFAKGISGVKQWTGGEYREMEKVFLGVIAGGEGATANIMHAARALLDFILMAQLPSHTDSVLKDMDDALDTFHRYKDAFIKAGARDPPHFNIPKIHALVHYTAAIRAFGSPDGYNTELPERLHIDLAKAGYRHSSRKDYGPQMVNWLARQERLWKLEAYVLWINPDAKVFLAAELDAGRDGVGKLDEDDLESGPDQELLPEEEDVDVDVIWHKTPILERLSIPRLAKQAPFPNLLPHAIETAFSAPNFLSTLHRFLRRELPSHAYHKPNPFDRFAVYKNMSITVRPNIRGGKATQDRIRAVPSKDSAGLPASVRKLARKKAYFDVALAKLSRSSDYRPVRVRTIFRVPDSVSLSYNHPLAYVELFTEIPKKKEKAVSMYKVKYERDADGEIRSAIVRLDWIQRSCLLLPVFGKKIAQGWRNQTVLELCKEYLVDDLLDIDCYLTM